jgi:cytochrome c-type biogenesis protein CcmF
VLLFSSFFVLFGTMFPTLSEAVRGEPLTVGPPFFDKWMLPIGLTLLFLTGVGPMLAWRKSTWAAVKFNLLWPVVWMLATIGFVRWLGVGFWASGLCFGLCAFVTGAILQEFWRGAGVRKQATGTDRFTALVGLFSRSRRRYGGYIVHIGIVLVFLGFAGNGSKREVQIRLEAGQSVDIAPYRVTFEQLRVGEDSQKQTVTAQMRAYRSGKDVGGMYPARWFFHKHESEPTTEVAIRRSVPDDLYIVMAAYDTAGQTGTFKIFVNPLVNWIWMGMGIIILGTFIALIPERAMAFATARVPAGSVPTALLLLFILGAGQIHVHAQHIERPEVVVVPPKTPLEQEMQSQIICMCGTCGRRRIGECTCPDAERMRGELAVLVEAGKSKDEIINHFVKTYGSQEVLAQPIDKGFNRLVWALPYAAGAAGVLMIVGFAVVWSRRRGGNLALADAATPMNAEMSARVDDELRDLD